MKQTKKGIALLTALMLLLSMVPAFAAANDGGGASESEIAFLTGMGFMENDSENDFGAARTFTRGELAAVLCGIMNLSAAAVQEDSAVCDDVTGKYEYAGYVKTLLDAGYMTLDKNGKFWPRDAVTFDDACAALVALAGGKVHLADEDAASVAVRLGLFSRGRVSGGKLNKGQVAALLYDTLHAPYYDQVAYGEKETFSRDKQYLVLEAVTGTVFAQGIVSGANRTSLTRADETVNNNEVLIDGIYYSGVENSQAFLGRAVNYYYPVSERGKARRQMTYIQQDTAVNQELVVSADLINDVSEGTVRYYNSENDSQIRTAKVTEKTNVIYNRMAYPAWSDQDLEIPNGKLTFLDNNRDGSYDVLFVETYRFMVMGYFDSSTQTMLDQYSGDMLDLDEEGMEYQVYRENGETAALSRVARAGALMAVQESKPSQGIKNVAIYVGGSTVTGQVKAVSDREITVADTTAKLAGTVTGGIDVEQIYLGRTVTAYLWAGEIVRIEEPGTSTAYPSLVYLIHAKMKDEAFNSTLAFRWCSKTGTFVEADGARSITVDGTSMRNMNDVLNRLNQAARTSKYSEDYPYAQPAQIYTNSKGEVYKIDTVLFDPEHESRDTSLVKDMDLSTVVYSSYNRSFYANGELFVSFDAANTAYFLIPNDRGDESWYLSGKGVVSMTNGSNQNIEPFFVKENRVAGVVISYYTPTIPVSTTSNPGIITDIYQVVNDQGEQMTRLALFNINGAAENLDIPASGVSTPNLRVGDVIRWRKAHDGELVSIDLTFSPYAPPGPDGRVKVYSSTGTTATGTLQRGHASIYGTLLGNTDGYITVTSSLASDPDGVETMSNLDNFMTASNTNYYRLENYNGYKVRTVSANQMVPYHMNKDQASEVYLFVSGNALRMVYEIALDD